MSKRLVVILILILGMMYGAALLTNQDSRRDNKTNGSLAAMVGKSAPDFSLNSYDGKRFTLSQQRGKKVIIFFNEGIMCYPACWNQMAALGSEPKFNSDQVVAVSIVGDRADEWLQAVKKMPELGKGTILLDTDKKVSGIYNMLYLPSSMHRGSLPGHTYLIIDENGIVRYTLDDPSMGIQNNILINELEKI